MTLRRSRRPLPQPAVPAVVDAPGSTGSNTAMLWITMGLLSLAVGWDVSGLDMAAARVFGGPTGFPLREHWLFSTVSHEGGRLASWAMLLWLCVAIRWPSGWLKRIELQRRWQLAVSCLVAVIVVSSIKSFSATSCPWDLADFGRTARHVSHWAWSVSDGAGGRCFPAGHASAGFAFVSGYFAFRERETAIARAWLVTALMVGLVLGVAQQVRGAHFMSHTLWTACFCWLSALAVDAVFSWRARSLRAGPCLPIAAAPSAAWPRHTPVRPPASPCADSRHH